MCFSFNFFFFSIWRFDISKDKIQTHKQNFLTTFVANFCHYFDTRLNVFITIGDCILHLNLIYTSDYNFDVYFMYTIRNYTYMKLFDMSNTTKVLSWCILSFCITYTLWSQHSWSCIRIKPSFTEFHKSHLLMIVKNKNEKYKQNCHGAFIIYSRIWVYK